MPHHPVPRNLRKLASKKSRNPEIQKSRNPEIQKVDSLCRHWEPIPPNRAETGHCTALLIVFVPWLVGHIRQELGFECSLQTGHLGVILAGRPRNVSVTTSIV